MEINSTCQDDLVDLQDTELPSDEVQHLKKERESGENMTV